MRPKLWLAVICGCASMAFPASAAATITASTVTSPPSGSWLIDDQVAPHEAITVAGTTVSGTTGDAVDLVCYSGASGRAVLATNVPVAQDGSFSVTVTQGLRQLARETCVLRAVPAGDTNAYPPGAGSPWGGPTLSIDQVTNTLGPSGQLEYYTVYAAQLLGAFDFSSLGNCPVADSYAYDAFTFARVPLAACDGGFSSGNSGTAPTRSELRVDGADAFLAGNAFDIGGFHGGATPGYPSLGYAYSIDPATGNLVLDEIDLVVRCSPGGTYPPTGATCVRFVPTGVAVRLHITQAQSGRMATVVQYFSSTDARTHILDLLVGNQFRAPGHDGEISFPWTGTGLQMYTQPGQVLPGPSRGAPGSFYIKGSAAVPDGGEASPQGAVSFSNPPSSVTVVQPTTSGVSRIELGYLRTVPASGSVDLGFTFSDAFYATEVAGYAASAEAAFRPSVAIVSPADGAATSKAHVNVAGAASDRTGLSAVVVDGRLAAVESDGTWTAPVALRPGRNKITAAAINAFGNVTQTQTMIMYLAPRPRVRAVSETHTVWTEGGGQRGNRPPKGTTFRFSLNEAVPVALEFTRQLPGRRMGRRCVALPPSRALSRAAGSGGTGSGPPGTSDRRGRKCVLTATVATTSVRGHAGVNRFHFAGIVNGRALDPGQYTLVITASDGGVLSRPKRLTFTIVP